MPEITKHVETMLSYVDLQTTDLEGAKAFYTKLFGWDVEEVPMGEGAVYAFFKKNGRTAAAAALQQPEQREAGIPPLWNTYFTVSDVDNRTKEAEQAGGTILAQPFDVFDSGRMSVIADPNGAVFSMWQATNHIGAEVMNEHGSLTWAECMGDDVDKGRKFYTELFGWNTQEMPTPEGGTYIIFRKDERPVVGLMGKPMPEMPSFWLNYFFVDDCAAIVKAATDLGSTTQVDTTPVPGVGKFAILIDPQGAGFGVLEPEPQSQP